MRKILLACCLLATPVAALAGQPMNCPDPVKNNAEGRKQFMACVNAWMKANPPKPEVVVPERTSDYNEPMWVTEARIDLAYARQDAARTYYWPY